MTSQARHRSVPLADNDPIERWKHPSADVTLLHPIRRLQTASKSVQADPQLLRRFLATTQPSSPPPTLSDGVRPPDGFRFSRFCLASQTEGLGRARLQVLAPGPSWTLLDQVWVPRILLNQVLVPDQFLVPGPSWTLLDQVLVPYQVLVLVPAGPVGSSCRSFLEDLEPHPADLGSADPPAQEASNASTGGNHGVPQGPVLGPALSDGEPRLWRCCRTRDWSAALL